MHDVNHRYARKTIRVGARHHDIQRKRFRYSWERKVGIGLLVAIVLTWAVLTA